MIDEPLITLALAPLLLPQGIYTRKVTPKLPEPTGGREGVSGQGSPLRVFIVGDSAAAGVGVDDQCRALSGQLISKLEKTHSVEWRLLAETGLKTQELIERLEAIDSFDVDIVVTSLGVNDVTAGTRQKDWLRLQNTMRSLLLNKFKAKSILLSSVPPMHEFPALPQPLRWFLGRRSTAFNQLLERYAKEHQDLEYVNVKFPMEADFFAQDGFHPSARAYELWSTIILQSLRQRGVL